MSPIELWMKRKLYLGRKMNDLKSCPFCGSNDIKCLSNLTEDIFFVSCLIYEANGSWKSNKKLAYEAWNERT